MLLQLTDDQEFFRDTTARFLARPRARRRGAPPARRPRRLRRATTGRRGAELGWTSLLVAEAHGGGSISDAGLVDLTLVADAFGRRAAPGPLIPDQRGGRHAERRRRRRAGRRCSTALLAGSVGRHLVRRRAARPTRASAPSPSTSRVDGADVVLAASKRPVESADQADHLLVTGRTGDGLTQVLVPADAAGRVDRRRCARVDLTRRFSVVSFDDVRLPAEHRGRRGRPGRRRRSSGSCSAPSCWPTPSRSAPCRRAST